MGYLSGRSENFENEFSYQNNAALGGGLPNVSDPEKTYANITRQEYLDYVSQYRAFE